jgi:cytochrome P450
VPFTRKAASEHVYLIQGWIERHMTGLAQAGRLSGGILDPAGDLKMLPFWITAEVLYGKLSDQQILELKELAVLREQLFKIAIRGGLPRFSFSRYFPTQANKRLARFRTAWAEFNDVAYKSSLSHSPIPPIHEMCLLCQSGTITQEQLLHTLDEALFANLDVTTGGMSWVLVLLAANRQYQEKIRNELRMNDANNRGSRKPYILASGTLLAACISEAARLRPLAAFSVPQSLPTPRIVSGYMIPAGTDFIVDTYGLNTRNASFWGPDAALFRPERFFEHSTELRYHYWRFGFGPRQCMGRYLADFMIRALVIHLVEFYDLSLVEGDSGKDWDRVPDMWINHPDIKIRCVRKA